MKKFYFVGGPKMGRSLEFFRPLQQIGGTPTHLVDAESQDRILDHLEHFRDVYEWSEIVEIVEAKS